MRTRLLAATLSAALLASGASAALAEDPAVDPADGTYGIAFEDPEGDAKDLLILTNTPLPSSDTLDLTNGRIGFVHDTSTLVFEIGVTDLTELPPEGATGKVFYMNFTYGAGSYFVTAADDLTKGQSFNLGTFEGDPTPLRKTLPAATVTGTFDYDNDVVRMELPASEFLKAVPGAEPFAPGAEISFSDVLGQRYINLQAAGITPTADTAVGDYYDIPEAPAEEATEAPAE